jgi:hypothetical protein
MLGYSPEPVIGRHVAPTRWRVVTVSSVMEWRRTRHSQVPGGGAKKQRLVPSGRLQRQ